MSTSPEPVRSARSEDEIVSALSHWLAYHLGNAELRARLRELGTDCLDPEQAEMVDEVLAELEQAPEGERGELEMLVRETLEAVALG
jgi:(p)ppGpp synthase/HD superfamily hydrolase